MYCETRCINKHFTITIKSLLKKLPRTAAAAAAAAAAANFVPASVQVLLSYLLTYSMEQSPS